MRRFAPPITSRSKLSWANRPKARNGVTISALISSSKYHLLTNSRWTGANRCCQPAEIVVGASPRSSGRAQTR